jgi:hypothetical protein
MEKIYYNKDGWVCERYPYDIPVEDESRFIEVDEDTKSLTMSCEIHKSWRVKNNNLFIDVYEETPEIENIIFEKQEIQNWFRETDWIPNKIITGEWQTNDVRWTNYIAERKIKRARQDEIDNLEAEILFLGLE